MGSIWHIGIAVPDLEKGKKELGEVFGLRWRPPRVRKLTLADAAGRPYAVECHVAFSLGGPFAVEVWQAIPGTPLDMPEGGGVHHIGYWVDDLAAEAKRLDALGYPSYATAASTPLLNRGPAGTLIEPCDLHSDRPSLRDLFPPGSEFAGWRSQHPQHRRLDTAMHPSSRTGVRFVLANPSDPSRLNEFNDWYDTYSAAITVPGYLANDAHFENPDASGESNSPRYATIYDIVTPDPATAWPDTEHSPAYPTSLFSDPRAKLVSPALRASYALVGSQLQPGQHGPLTGIHVILSNGGSDTERQHREAQILQTGLFYSAARFRIIEGSPEPAEWLEVFETDHPDPFHAYPRAASHTPPASQIQPQLSQSFRLAGHPQNQTGF